MRYHQPTSAYSTARTSEGKNKREIMRCLKRYLAREVYTALAHTTRRTETRPSRLTSIGASHLTGQRGAGNHASRPLTAAAPDESHE